MPMSWGSLSVMGKGEYQWASTRVDRCIKLPIFTYRSEGACDKILDRDGHDVAYSWAGSNHPNGGHARELCYYANNHYFLVMALKTCVVALYAHPELSSRAREAIQAAEAVLGQLDGKE